MKVNAKAAAKQRKLAVQLGEIGFALPGSLTVKAYRCGKANCRCKGEPPRLHGPYAFWTRKVNAKTVTRMLSDEELTEYQPMFDNARKLRDLVSELQELTMELIEHADRDSSNKATKTSRIASTKARPPKPIKG